eukprot:Sro33_g021340.2  (558) ;mRNA; f:56393-58066
MPKMPKKRGLKSKDSDSSGGTVIVGGFASSTGRGLRKNRDRHGVIEELTDGEQTDADVVVERVDAEQKDNSDEMQAETKEDEEEPRLAVATALTQADLEDEIRRQIMEDAVVGVAVREVPVGSPPSFEGKDESVQDKTLCGFPRRKVVYVALCIAIVVLIGIVLGLALSRSSDRNDESTQQSVSSQTISFPANSNMPSEMPSDSPTRIPSHRPSSRPSTNPSSAPSTNPSSSSPSMNPTALETVSYTQSFLAPNRNANPNFNHLERFGATPAGESSIHKISQIQVYATTVCVTNNDCSLPTATVLSLATTYVLTDCTTSRQTNGAYTGDGRSPKGVINLKSNQYITKIEMLTDRWPIHIRICTSDNECFGPFGSSLDQEPNTFFESPSGSVIHSFYGYSGSWLDHLGVYYEHGVRQTVCATLTSVTVKPEVTSFVLINVDDNSDIRTLESGNDTVYFYNNSTDGPTQLSIRAATNPSSRVTVKFYENGINTQTENAAPYALNGDTNEGTIYGAVSNLVTVQDDLVIKAVPSLHGETAEGISLEVTLSIRSGDSSRWP